MSTQTDDSAGPDDNGTEAKKPTGKRVALGCAVMVVLVLTCTVAIGVFADPEDVEPQARPTLEPLTEDEAACLALSAEVIKAQAKGTQDAVIALALAGYLGTSVAEVTGIVQVCTRMLKDYNDRNDL